MRIVGGKFRGKKLHLPEDNRVRPTADRTREALFNILAHGSDYRTDEGPLPLQAKVLDVFAGTGALGIEALSRGAAHVTFMDNHAGSLKLVRQNVTAIQAQQKSTLLNRDGIKPGKAGHPVDLVLMDPPYSEGLEQQSLTSLREGGWLRKGTIVVIEQAVKEKLEIPSGFEELDNRKYGAARLVILKNT